MSSRKPVRHADDHLEGGEDALAAVNVPWALTRGGVAVPAAAAATYADLSSLIAYGKNDDTGLYALAFGAGPLAAIHGITVAEQGVYRIKGVFVFDTFTVGDQFECLLDNGMGAINTWPIGDPEKITLALDKFTVAYEYLCFVGGTLDPGPVAPFGTWPHVIPFGAPNHTCNVNVELQIEQISKSYTAIAGTP